VVLGPRVSNKWLSAEIWRQALSMSRLIDPSLEITDYNFNKAMSSKQCPWHAQMGRKWGGSMVVTQVASFNWCTERRGTTMLRKEVGK
jgi:hypothetical protein